MTSSPLVRITRIWNSTRGERADPSPGATFCMRRVQQLFSENTHD
jgi:hypothetical protein